MAKFKVRTSTLGLVVALLGVLVGLAGLASVANHVFFVEGPIPDEFGFGIAFLALLSISLIFMGLRWWITFRAAEGIADWSEKAEKRGVHPLVTLAVAVVFGGAMLFRPVYREIKTFLSQPGALENDGFQLELLVLGAPAIIFVLGTLIMVHHRRTRPRSIEDHMSKRQGEKRHTLMLLVATPFLILVPYFIWVGMQPGPEVFSRTNMHNGELIRP